MYPDEIYGCQKVTGGENVRKSTETVGEVSKTEENKSYEYGLTLRELYVQEAVKAVAGKLTSNDGGKVYAHRIVYFVDEIIKEMGK